MSGLRRMLVNAGAFFSGYTRFKVTWFIEQPGQPDAPYVSTYVFWTYAAADDALQALLDANCYDMITFTGFNCWYWLARNRYGAWRSFYTWARGAQPNTPPDWIASARLT